MEVRGICERRNDSKDWSTNRKHRKLGKERRRERNNEHDNT
jgi:hypothetical protein